MRQPFVAPKVYLCPAALYSSTSTDMPPTAVMGMSQSLDSAHRRDVICMGSCGRRISFPSGPNSPTSSCIAAPNRSPYLTKMTAAPKILAAAYPGIVCPTIRMTNARKLYRAAKTNRKYPVTSRSVNEDGQTTLTYPIKLVACQKV